MDTATCEVIESECLKRKREEIETDETCGDVGSVHLGKPILKAPKVYEEEEEDEEFEPVQVEEEPEEIEGDSEEEIEPVSFDIEDYKKFKKSLGHGQVEESNETTESTPEKLETVV